MEPSPRTRSKSRGEHADALSPWALLLWRQAGRAGTLQPGERKPRRDLVYLSILKYLVWVRQRRRSQVFLSGVQ